MLSSYQHCYHAGNFLADLHQAVICIALQWCCGVYLQKKDSAIPRFLDTHAGTKGLYRLDDPQRRRRS